MVNQEKQTEQKRQLPLFQDNTKMPTDKHHISFSELFDWYECSFRHKLKYVDKIDLDGPSIHTEFGQVIHNALETYAKTGALPAVDECLREFEQRLGELLFSENAVSADEAKEFVNALPDILEQTPKWLDKNFPGWKLVSAEEMLFEPINGQTNKHFKGFVDLVIKVPKRKKKKSNKTTRLSNLRGEETGEYVYWVIDYKTTNWGWRAEQKRAFEKQMQIILYKYFWCKRHNIDLKDARCGFVFLKRKPNKHGERVNLLPISAGPKAVEKSLAVLHDAINQINMGIHVKNKFSCRFCPYAGTVYCP